MNRFVNFSIPAFTLCFLSILFSPCPLSAQTAGAYERAGDRAFRQKDYAAALQQYAVVLAKKDKAAVRWKYAECARLVHAYAEAEQAYRRLSGSKKYPSDFPLLDFRLGQVRRGQGDYAGAIDFFERFLAENSRAGSDFFPQARAEIAACQWAQIQPPVPDTLTLLHPGKEINSPYSDFGAVLRGDTLFFSSYRFDKRGERGQRKTKLTRIMLSIRGSRAREPARGFPAGDSTHVAHTAFTPDGNFLFFTRCKNLDARDIRCELWLTLKDRRGRWVAPLRLPAPVNLPGYTSTQPSVGYDTTLRAPVLWFASDRPGGQGGLDLWSTPLDTIWFCPCTLPEGGKKMSHPPGFAAPVNAGPPVNTAADELTPFFHDATQTLWFSTDRLPGFGGYDIFSAPKSAAGFAPPANAGAGINTSYNDLYFYLRPDGLGGYLSSNRPGAFYLDEANKACCNDIFAFRYPQPPDTTSPPDLSLPAPRTSIAPRLIPVESLQEPEEQPRPVLTDFVGLPLYFDNDEPDKRTRRTTTKQTYEATATAYLARQDEYRARFSAGLTGARLDEAEATTDAFFEGEVLRGYERLNQLCDLLLWRLQAGETVEIVIKGFTSPRAQSDYNLRLGHRRITSVRNHFAAWNQGALQAFLRAGQLKITETSFGETTASHGVSDELADERNSIYSPAAARERRVEIVEIRHPH